MDWNAQILSKRVRDSNDNWLGDNVAAQKIADAVNEGADVLNCSWSGPVNSSTLAVAFAYAYRANRVTVATMGNTGVQETRYPEAFPNVMAVGSTQNDDTRSPFSTAGTHIDVVAPGGIHPEGLTNEQDIITTTTNSNYEYTSGTSFAAPQVAGLASLLEGYNSNLDNNDIRQIIRLSADDRGIIGFDNQYGFGRINAGRALEFLQAPNTLNQWTASGGTVESTVGLYTMTILGAPGLASANYFVKRYEVRKQVTFPEDFIEIEGVWGRGVSTNGWSMANPNLGEGFCEMVPGTLTETGVTLSTYVYEVYTTPLQYVGYYPTTPANVNFAYTVLGIPQPTISAPDIICYSGHTVSLQDAPANTTITWGGSYVTYPNGNTGTSVTVRAASSSEAITGTITASFSIDGTPYTISKTVGVNGPQNEDTELALYTSDGTPVSYMCPDAHYHIYLNNSGGCSLSNYDWSIPTGWVENYTYNNMISVYTGSSPGGMVEVYATTCCNDNVKVITDYFSSGYCSSSYVLSFSPNPATGETTLSIEPTTEETQFDINEEWDLEIYNNNQTLKEKKTKLKGNEYKLNTSGWKDGVYMVRVNYKDEVLTGKLVVQR